MEIFLTRLVTYRIMDGYGLVNDLLSQPIEKILFSLLLFASIIGSSFYVVRRTFFQHRPLVCKGNTHGCLDPQLLINLWISENRHFCVNVINLCVAFINTYRDRVKVPNGIKYISFLPRVSSSVTYSLKSAPSVSANIMSISVLITADRLSFFGEPQGSQKLSHIKFSLSNFSLEVTLHLSFNNTDLITLRGVSSHPQFSLSIESVDPMENAEQDLLCTVEDIVSNLDLIWKTGDSLLENQQTFKSIIESDDLFSDLDSKVTEKSEELHLQAFFRNSYSELKVKEDTKTPIELDANILTELVNPLPEAARINVIPLNGHLHTADVSIPSSESDDSTEVLLEPVVLAHNPSLSKRLSESVHYRHKRSASDFIDQGLDEPTKYAFNDAETVPLDPIVHPPEEHHYADNTEGKSVSPMPNQRSLKKVTDVSPFHERVAPNLASKNLLVKVVKADFIDLKASSDAYCVVELDEPYQRHATHVVPPSDQLFWDQHLLFGLNSNSKRASFEVFEFSKRRRSISRGYAEVCLSDLLTSSVGGCSGELLRCIPLDPKQHSSSTLGLTANGGKWEYCSTPVSSSTSLTVRRPTVTAEFNFMERIVDDSFSICKGRSGVGSPTPLSKLRAEAMTSAASSSDSSLSQTAGATTSDNSGVGANGDRSSQGSKEGMQGNGQLEVETPKDVTPTPHSVKCDQQESHLQRSTSTRGSRLFEPAFENLRLADNNAALTIRHQHTQGYRAGGGFSGFRRKSMPRVLSGGVGGAGLGAACSPSASSGFGLLGPSSQLAGVVAGLTAASVDSSYASVDPSTAAAVASAVAVAAATGRSSTSPDCKGVAAGGGGPADSLFEGTAVPVATTGHFEHEPPTDTVVRYAAPAANIAESLGTYSVQPPPRRPDATGMRLRNLFKSKRKHHQPSGMERLLYLQNLEGSEFDAISAEGYQRIIHGDQMQKQ